MRVSIATGAFLVMGLLGGCTTEWTRTDSVADPVPAHMKISGVPFHPQPGIGCGPAAMAMMLGWAGVEVSPAVLADRFSAAADPRAALVDTARLYGRFAHPVAGIPAMMAELAAGHPVLVLENLGVPSAPIWNCAVSTGWDRPSGKVLVNAGREAGKAVSIGLLDRLWTDSGYWGLVVVPPGDLPATASERSFLDAARGLEQAGRTWEAVLAYDTALSRWPAGAEALMGLGSSLHRLGDPDGAADAYRNAAALASDPQPALEALSRVTAEIRRRDQATAQAVPINLERGQSSTD